MLVAIEPVPVTFSDRAENIRHNDLGSKITAVQSAVSLTGTTAEWCLQGLGSERGAVIVRQTTLSNRSGIRETVSVPASGLGDTVADLGVEATQVAFVWCDTQGSEADVIASGMTLWNAGVPLYTELWPRGLASHGGSERLLELAESTFAGFVGRDDLVDHGANATAQPIAELRGVDSLAGGRYSTPCSYPQIGADKLPPLVGRWRVG